MASGWSSSCCLAVTDPAQHEERIAKLEITLINIHFLLNSLRPHQVRVPTGTAGTAAPDDRPISYNAAERIGAPWPVPGSAR